MQKLKNLNETEFNEKCAEFLGFKCSINKQYELPNMMTFPPKGNSYLCHTAKVCCLEDMQFHNDWNWLQEVKAKICSLKIVDEFEVKFDSAAKGFYGHISPSYKDSFEYFTTGNLAVGTDSYPTELEATIDLINQFLTWYETHV
jgi:hypothetical protein